MPPTTSARLKRLAYFLGDLVLLNIAFLLGYFLRFHTLDGVLATETSPYSHLLLFYNLAWLGVSLLLNTYEFPVVWTYRQMIGSLLRVIAIHLLVVAMYWVARKGYFYSRMHLAYTYMGVVVLLTAWRTLYLVLQRMYRRSGRIVRNAVVLGQSQAVQSLVQFFHTHPEHGYRLLRVFNQAEQNDPVADAKRFLQHHRVDEIYASLTHLSNDQVRELIDFADRNLIRVKLLPDFRGFEPKDLRIDLYGNLPVVAVRQYPLDEPWNAMVKRGFDVAFSLLFLLLIGSWLFPVIALLVKLSSPGPIFFLQLRHGKNGKEFWCWKFRTMRVNSDSDSKQATRGDSRITPIGAFLRRTNLDELPQFINILIGDMSVVGPRPHMVKHTEQYTPLIDKYMLRHIVKPGLTGLAQARGYRGETPTVQYMKNRVKMDRFYVDNWSLALDLKIIVATVTNMVRGEENAF